MFFDIEAMQPQEQHVANLIVAETEDNPQPFRFRGDQCVQELLEWLDTLTLNETRPVNVITHNFQHSMKIEIYGKLKLCKSA